MSSAPATASCLETRDRAAPLWRPARWIGAALVVLVVLIYAPTLQYPFLEYEDPAHVTANVEVLGGLTLDNLRWALTSTTGDRWQPVTWLSHMLDIELFGERPGRHHASSVLLHALNVLLLYVALRRATGATFRPAVAAALFAVHPIHAESVAWISARKDLLAGLFALLALHAHIQVALHRRPAAAFAGGAAFALGLAARPVLVSWPLVLLLVDCWPLGRAGEGWRALVREKAFPLALAGVACIAAVAVVTLSGSVTELSDTSAGQRTANALVSYVRYLAKLVWPHDLAILYTHPQAAGGTPWSSAEVLGSAALLASISFAALRLRDRAPYLWMGWMWFVIALLPVIGLVQIGPQAMADRFAYLPAVGLYITLAWGAAELARRSPALRIATGAATCVVVVGLGLSTAAHLGHFETSEGIWRQAARVDPRSWFAYSQLGNVRYAQGRTSEAVAAYQRAVALEPGEPGVYNDLAWVLATTDDPTLRDGPEALRLALHAARATSYGDAGVLDTLAAAYAAAGQYRAAETWAGRGAAIADEDGEELLAKVIRSHMAHFREGRALGE